MELADELGVIGLKVACDSNQHWIRRITWSVLIAVGLVWTSSLIFDTISHYLSNPKSININIVSNEELEFPTVTICSQRLFGADWLKEQKGRYLAYRNFVEIVFNPYKTTNEILNISNPLSRKDSEMLYTKSATNLIGFCAFAGERCLMSRQQMVVTDYLQCLAVNTNETNKYAQKAAGLHQGLYAHVRVQHSDFIDEVPQFGNGDKRDFAVAIHDATEMIYFMREDGISLPAGKEIKVGLTKTTTTLLPGDDKETACETQPGYYKEACMIECMIQIVYFRCRCIVSGLELDSTQRICETSVDWKCNIETLMFFQTNSTLRQTTCKCKESCTVHKYNTIVTLSNIREGLLDTKNGSDFSIVQIYYSSLAVEYISQQLDYGFWSMLTDIGGALGLFVGSALYTIVQLMEFILTSSFNKICIQSKPIHNINVPKRNIFLANLD